MRLLLVFKTLTLLLHWQWRGATLFFVGVAAFQQHPSFDQHHPLHHSWHASKRGGGPQRRFLDFSRQYSSVVTSPPSPDVSTVASFIEARQAVEYLRSGLPRPQRPAKVLVIGGGLAGLSAAKHLADAGHYPVVLEARQLLGGKVAAWRDSDGDVSETGLHVFFGAYPNALNLFEDLHISDRLSWKPHQMWFAQPPDKEGYSKEEGGVGGGDASPPKNDFSVFDFPSNVPAPLNAAWAILTSDMITLPQKLQLGLGLIPAYLQGQSYVESQEGITVQEWMDRRGIPQSVTDEVFDPMSKALGFIGAKELSMQCVLIALNRFLQETSGSRLAFLDGSPTERLCEPLKDYIEAKGGTVRVNAPVERILVNDHDQTVAGLLLNGGEVVSGDYYVNAMPVDALKKLTPESWRSLEYFDKLRALRGVPVMNLHVWFDRKLSTVDNLIFSRSPFLSVYADMSVACQDYASDSNSMLELVLAPAAKYMTKTDDDILQAVLVELERLFPGEIRADGSLARVTKYTIVRTPTSVYETTPGTEDARPTQTSPIANFFVAGDFSKQRYLASMEGAILSGKLAAKAVAEQRLRNEQEGEQYSPPRQLSERPRDPLAEPWSETPERTMYVARVTPIPSSVQSELMGLSSTSVAQTS